MSEQRIPDPVDLLRRLRALRRTVDSEARAMFLSWRPTITRRAFLSSAQNLAHYLALRSHDLRALQAALVPWGLSSLGRSEARVLPNLDAVISTLAAVVDDRAEPMRRPSLQALHRGERRLSANTIELFGPPRKNRTLRIMVTLPREVADDYAVALDLVRRGMDCARINCAHDDEGIWERMAINVRRASAETGFVCRVVMDLSGPRLRITEVRLPTPLRRVVAGDTIALTGRPGLVVTAPFEARCSAPDVIGRLRVGDHIWVDEGRFGTVVEAVAPEWASLRVEHVPPKGAKLMAEKGLNVPGVSLGLQALTDEDRSHLDFIVRHADIIGYSFVQDANDVAALQAVLRDLLPGEARLPPLITKIETRRAVANLPAIIVRAAGQQPLGVMIARGDLGVELGYERLAEIQEEILWLCEAAHIPVIWATHVLDRLVKKGTPSRAEMTDAAMSERAECVMLNKGPYVARAIETLADVLTRMESHQHKKTPHLRALRVWREHLPAGRSSGSPR